MSQICEHEVDFGSVFSRFGLLCLLIEEIEGLLSHDGVVALEGNEWRRILDDPRNTGPGRVSSAAEALPDLKNTVECLLGEKRLHAGSIMVAQVELSEIHFLNTLEENLDLGVGVLRREQGSEEFGDDREELHLLSLVVEQLRLLFAAADVLELASTE